MFGPYDIEHNGQRHYGNVSLRECHTFDSEGNAYLFDVLALTAHPVTPRLAELIGRLAAFPHILVPETDMEALHRLGIVADQEALLPETESPPRPETTSGKPEFPVESACLFLAQECNLRCVYCYGDAGEYHEGGLMDKATALRAVDWLVENSGSRKWLNIAFFGGEPLLNFPLLRTVVSYARQKAASAGKEMTFSLTTNGTLLTDEALAFIQDETIKTVISFDGPPEVHDRQRPFRDGGGSYDRIVGNIRKLLRRNPHVPARATVYGDNDPVLIKQGLQDAGFTVCFLTPASPVLLEGSRAALPTASGERRLERMGLVRREEAGALLAAIRERQLDKHGPHAPTLSEMASLFTGQKRHHGCGLGKGMVGIAANGDVYPCHRFVGVADMRQGNIADYKAGAVNAYYQATVDTLPECKRCWVRYLCGGGCFYHNKATTGDLHRPDPLACREKQLLYKELIRIYCQLEEDDIAYTREFLKNCAPAEHLP